MREGCQSSSEEAGGILSRFLLDRPLSPPTEGFSLSQPVKSLEKLTLHVANRVAMLTKRQIGDDGLLQRAKSVGGFGIRNETINEALSEIVYVRQQRKFIELSKTHDTDSKFVRIAARSRRRRGRPDASV